MINLMNKNMLSFDCEGEMKEEEYRNTEECEDIKSAIKTLHKHFDSLHIGGFSKSGVSVAYSQAPETDKSIEYIEDDKRKAVVARGGAACTDIAKVMLALSKYYGIDPNHMLETLSAAFAFFEDCDSAEHAENVLEKMTKAKSRKEAIDIVKKASKKAADILDDKNADKAIENLSDEAGENRNWIEQICDKIADKTGKSVIISLVEINGEANSTCEIGLRFNDNIYEKSKKSGVDVDKIELAVIGGTATSLMEHAHNDFDIRDNFFRDYCDMTKL